MRQVAAIISLRLKLLLRLASGSSGKLQVLGSALFAFVVFLLSSLLALGGGALASVAVSQAGHGELRVLLLASFWLVLACGLVLPLALAGGSHGLDVSKFLSLPMGHGRLFGVSLLSSFGSLEQLFCLPLLLALFLVLFGLPGESPLLAATFFLLVPLVVATWAHALTLLMKGVTRSRRAREALGIVFLTVFVALCFWPLILEHRSGEDADELVLMLRSAWQGAKPALDLLPPQLAVDGLTALRAGDGAAVGLALLSFLPWLLGGLFAGRAAFMGFVVDRHGGGAPRFARVRSSRGRTPTAFNLPMLLPSPIQGIASREWRYLTRSVVGRVNMILLPGLGLLAAMFYRYALSSPVLGVMPGDAVLHGMALYAVLFSLNHQINALAWEGGGFTSYLMNPVLPKQVLLGKNLGLWLYAWLCFMAMLLAWFLIAGFPGTVTVLTTSLLFCIGLIVQTTVGNFLSVWFPLPRDVSGMVNGPSQIAMLASLLVFVATSILLAGGLFLPALFGRPEFAPLVLFATAIASLGAWWLSLPLAGHLMHGRREAILSALSAGPS